jgi:flagellar hook protein FlgE
MLRSMFSAVSGLRSHQTMMDVVGNNISNVNTTGFKASRATFQEALTQVVRGGSGPIANNLAGVNPLQIGLGTRMGAIDAVFSQGATQLTGRLTDVAIQGDGFFVVQMQNQTFYSRAGAFNLDANNTLTGPNGERVQGWAVPNPAVGQDTNPGQAPQDLTLNMDGITDLAIGADGKIMGRNVDGEVVVLGEIAIARFPNPGGLTRGTGGLFTASPASGGANVGSIADGERGTLQSGTLEMSNVDLAQEFTNLIMAQRGFQANARTITASDELLQDLVNLKR